jgi:hypothetical protein
VLGARRVRVGAVSLFALLLLPAAAGAAQTHSLANRLTTGSTLVASTTGTLRFEAPNDYAAAFCIKDERADAIGPRVQLRYMYQSGAVHYTRYWGNDNGAGTSVCHEAWVDGSGPRIAWVSVTLIGDGQLRATCHYPNPYVLGGGAFGTTVRCGTPEPPPWPTTPQPPPPTPPPPPPPPVVAPPPPAPDAPPAPRGCTPSDRPVSVRLKRLGEKRSAGVRVLSVAFWLRGKDRRQVDRRPPFRAVLRHSAPPGARLHVIARVRYRWRKDDRVYTRQTSQVVKICR